MRIDFRDKFTQRKARGSRICEDASDKSSEPPLLFLRRVRLRGAGADERSDTAARLQDASAF
jgi:hypothetical protein